MKKYVLKILILSLMLIFSAVTFATEKIMEISKIESNEQVYHSSEVGGKILKINYKSGDFVKKDDVIMVFENKQITAYYEEAKCRYETAKLNYEKLKKFDEDKYKLNLEKAKRAVIASEMSLQKAKNGTKQEELDRLKLNIETAKVNYETIKDTYEKNKILYEKDSISEQNYLQIKAKYESAENAYYSAKKVYKLAERGADIEDIKSLEAAVVEAKANYEVVKKTVDDKIWEYDINLAKANMKSAEAAYILAKDKNEKLEIKAEISGIISDLDIDSRNRVLAGKKLFSILDVDKMVIKTGIDEKYISELDKDVNIDIYVSAVKKHYKGKIKSINPIENDKTKKFDIKIKMNNMDHILKNGMHGEVTIKL